VSTEGLTLDRFLDGRVTAAQPTSGFRAGHDTVLLAAAVPAENDSVVLELGAGAGVASLCLAARVPRIHITGIEIDPELVRLANENAVRNSVADRVSFVTGDASDFTLLASNLSSLSWPAKAGHLDDEGYVRHGGSFDHVFFNPPFHPDTGQASPFAARDRATRDSHDAVREWTARALSFVRDGGTVTAIIRADRVKDIQDAASVYGGVVFPLLPRAGAKPKRMIVRIVKAKAAGFSRAAGLILHKADGRNTEAAENVLRHALPLW
jgi:tRNA1(Val) A37 N6-methylase TrmN6